jgi:predicted ABC-type ATPase
MTHEGDASKKHNRTISIVAGPNGAGKSTFVENYLNRYIDCDEFLNADLIARGLSPFAPERQALRASEIFLQRLDELAAGNSSFALETTLAGRSYRRRIPRWKNSDFALLCFSFGYQPRKLLYGELRRELNKAVTISLFPIFDGDMHAG